MDAVIDTLTVYTVQNGFLTLCVPRPDLHGYRTDAASTPPQRDDASGADLRTPPPLVARARVN